MVFGGAVLRRLQCVKRHDFYCRDGIGGALARMRKQRISSLFGELYERDGLEKHGLIGRVIKK
jgi:hypothetical protein